MKNDHRSYIRTFCYCKTNTFLLFTIAKVVYIVAMIILHLILHSPVHMYDFHIFITSSSSFHAFIMNQFNNLLPVGLLASLVERCTVTAEVKVRIPYKPEFFSGFLFATAKVAYSRLAIVSSLITSPHGSLSSCTLYFPPCFFCLAHNAVLLLLSIGLSANFVAY